MDLPPRSGLVHYTLETPWPLAIAVLIVGLLLLRWAAHQRSLKAAIISAVVVLLAMVVPIIAGMVETDSERVSRHSAELVDSVVANDVAQVSALLSNNLQIVVGREPTNLGKSDIIDGLSGISAWVASNRIRRVEAVATSERGNESGESIVAVTTQTTMGRPIPSEWRFVWQFHPDRDEWKVSRIVWTKWNLNDVPSAGVLAKALGGR